MDWEKMKAAGIHYDEGMERFSGNEQLYIKYLRKFRNLTLYNDMKSALRAGDYESAFQYAHDLKSFAGNISLNEFYRDISRLTDELRSRGEIKLTVDFDSMDRKYQNIMEVIGGELGE